MTREQVIEAVARAMYPSLVWGTDYEAVPFNEAWVRPRYAHLRQMIESGVKLALTAVLDATVEPDWKMQVAGRKSVNWPYRDIYGKLDDHECDDAASDIWRAMHAAMRRSLTDAEKEG